MTRGNGEAILAVEDNAVNQQALTDSLDMSNYRALTASDGREALEILERQHAQTRGNGGDPDADRITLVLSDLVMPGMGGLASKRAIDQRGLAVTRW